MRLGLGLSILKHKAVNTGVVLYESDFSSTTDLFSTIQASIASVDGIFGVDDVLRVTINSANSIHRAQRNSELTIGADHEIAFDYYIPSSNTNVDGIGVLTGSGADGRSTFNVLDAWTSATATFSEVEGNNLVFEMRDGASISFAGNGTDVIYLKNIVVTQF